MRKLPIYTDEEAERILEDAAKKGGRDQQLAENYVWAATFDHDEGIENSRVLSRRAWIENFFTIKKKDGQLSLLTLNAPQRRLERAILAMERAGLPVRVRMLKSRKMGFSTYVQGVMFERVLRGQNMQGLIVADKDDRAEMLLGIANLARRKMPKSEDYRKSWDFKMNARAMYRLAWEDPINGSIEITSAGTEGAGRGGTPDTLHLSETAFWKNAEKQAVGILESLADLPNTMAFDESTANGDTGWFRNEFWKGWEQRDVPLLARTSPWVSLFFAWYEDDGYRWTKTFGAGRELPVAMVNEIHRTLDPEEEWLLGQRYFVRRVGLKRVDYDQLAWRRTKIATTPGGVDVFNQEYPSRPELAFLATGAKVFNQDIIQRKLREVRRPAWTGIVEEPAEVAAKGWSAPSDTIAEKPAWEGVDGWSSS